MSQENTTILIPANTMQALLTSILSKEGFTNEQALQCSTVFTNNSVDGIATHGINRFPRFVQNVKDGFVKPAASPLLKHKFGGIEQWNGQLGPGISNAMQATERATQLATEHGIGCVALSNTNHWMRGGSYGWQAAKAGYVFIGFTNTTGNMPAWGAKDARLGNNPLVIALPYKEEAIVLDMAMSQFSFGAMESAAMKNERLPVNGGYDKNGILTDVPAEILATGRPLPVGYWKGAGLALLLDLLATILSGGLATHEISKTKTEHALSQVFIAIDIFKLGNHSAIRAMIENIILDYHRSVLTGGAKQILFPGERVLATRKENLANGIPVIKKIWEEINGLV